MELNHLESFRTKLAAKKVGVGLVVTLSDPAVSELAGDAGFDFTWIDAEHAPLTIQDVMGHVMAVRGTGCAPFVRVAWNQWGVIKPMLDLAPAGVIIPMVNDVEAARDAVASCKYPPAGNRGCGVRRGVRYGRTPFGDYLKKSASEPLVIVQIEHIDALPHLDEILAVPGIDSICVGPCDLSGSMGKLNQIDDPEVSQVIDEICRKTKQAGLLLGTASAPFAKWKERGVDWIALGSDCGCLFSAARKIVEDAQ